MQRPWGVNCGKAWKHREENGATGGGEQGGRARGDEKCKQGPGSEELNRLWAGKTECGGLTAVPRRACSPGWPQTGSRRWAASRTLPPATKSSSLCPNCVHQKKTWFMLNICFSCWESELGSVPGWRCQGNQPPVKTLGAESPVGFPG